MEETVKVLDSVRCLLSTSIFEILKLNIELVSSTLRAVVQAFSE